MNDKICCGKWNYNGDCCGRLEDATVATKNDESNALPKDIGYALKTVIEEHWCAGGILLRQHIESLAGEKETIRSTLSDAQDEVNRWAIAHAELVCEHDTVRAEVESLTREKAELAAERTKFVFKNVDPKTYVDAINEINTLRAELDGAIGALKSVRDCPTTMCGSCKAILYSALKQDTARARPGTNDA